MTHTELEECTGLKHRHIIVTLKLMFCHIRSAIRGAAGSA
jgi:hypothetical protein